VQWVKSERRFARYISGGELERDLETLYGANARRAERHRTAMDRQDLERMLESATADTTREALAFFDLYDAGTLPITNHFVAGIPYSLRDDFGDELRERLDGDEDALSMASSAIGIGHDGGGSTYFLLADGTTDILYMGELPYYWQNARFASLGQMCWVLFHAEAADDGRFPQATWEATVRELGCERAAVWSVSTIETLAPTLASRLQSV